MVLPNGAAAPLYNAIDFGIKRGGEGWITHLQLTLMVDNGTGLLLDAAVQTSLGSFVPVEMTVFLNTSGGEVQLLQVRDARVSSMVVRPRHRPGDLYLVDVAFAVPEMRFTWANWEAVWLSTNPNTGFGGGILAGCAPPTTRTFALTNGPRTLAPTDIPISEFMQDLQDLDFAGPTPSTFSPWPVQLRLPVLSPESTCLLTVDNGDAVTPLDSLVFYALNPGTGVVESQVTFDPAVILGTRVFSDSLGGLQQDLTVFPAVFPVIDLNWNITWDFGGDIVSYSP